MSDIALDSSKVTETVAAGRPPLSRRFVLALTILLGAFAGLGPLAIDMYLPSFPAIAKEFGESLSHVEQTLTAYLFGLAIGQLFYGPAADRYGRKTPLYVGLILFVVASVGCVFAPSVRWLLVLRVFQALGGCAEMVIARAIVRDLFDDKMAIRVFSSLLLVMGIAPILAPLLGGWIVGHSGWRSVFWVLVVAGVLCLLGALFLLPESLPPERRKRHSIAAVLRLYRGLFSHQEFIVHTLTIGLGCAAIFAYVGGSPGLFIETHHIPAQWFGLFFGANAFCLIGMSQVNSYLSHRFDPRKLLGWSLIASFVSSAALLGVVVTGVGGLWAVCPCLFVFMGAFGFIFPNTMALAMSPHGENAGNASGFLGFFQFLISAVGGIIVTNLPFSTPVSMAVFMTGSMGLIAIIRWLATL